ncbi:MAG: hypothetical protein K2Q11_10335 [Burkholderiaceae bacterium]|nr:hypothetical protein [Burkholderiaceae bacterium]
MPKTSRRDRLAQDGVPPQLPDVFAGQYLLDWLFEIGPTQPAGMGSGPVTFQELAAWQQQAGIELQPWEASMLRRLSVEYLNESYEATNAARPPPYGELHRSPKLDKKLASFLD